MPQSTMENKIKKYLPLYLSIKLANLKNAIAYHNPFCPKEIILGRNACLGNELLRAWTKKHKDFLVINQQRVRVDIFLDCANGAPRPKAGIIKKYFRLRRSDLNELVRQQENLPWLKNKRAVKYLVMDSFTELTDKKFTHRKENWSFCCYWNDLIHDEKFDKEFSSSGMLPLEDLEKSYSAFFDWANRKYPGIRIFFIHYPDRLEKREKYLERSKKIKEVLEKLSAENNFIKNIFLEEEKTKKNLLDEFPYHYGQGVYDELLKKLSTALEK
jgi:hypothetical protein